MATPDAALGHYARQARLTAAALTAARSSWSRLNPNNLDRSWVTIAPRLLVTIAGVQRVAALDAVAYVPRVLDELEIDAPPAGRVIPEALVGVASDGRSLDTLLYEPVIRTKQLIGQGASTREALAGGLATLERIISTQIPDAARVATGIGIASRPRVGYVRMLNAPSCSRCAVLAGKFFRFNQGFQRHPRCDCRHIPATEDVADDLTTDTDAYFRSLSEKDQDRYFTKAGAQAIRDGSDIGQVVNARRGMYQADGHLFTREGTTRRGSAGKRLMEAGAETTRTLAARRTLAGGEVRSVYQTRVQRIMPETIYAEARDRAHAIELLRRHGYLT